MLGWHVILSKIKLISHSIMSIERKEMMKKVRNWSFIEVFLFIIFILDQFKVIDTRRVKVPSRNNKSSSNNQPNKTESIIERPSIQQVSSPSPSNTISSIPTQIPTIKSTVSPTTDPQTPNGPPDYRFLLAWSYYLASQAAWLSPMLQQQQGQLPPSLPTDPEAAAKFLQQAMQTVMEPLIPPQALNNSNDDDNEQIESETSTSIKQEAK